MATQIADEEDLMDFDSDPYFTPDSAMTQPSPPPQSPSNKKSKSDPTTEEEIRYSMPTLIETRNLDAGVPEMEEVDDGGESDEESLAQTSDPKLRSISERKKARKMVFSSW